MKKIKGSLYLPVSITFNKPEWRFSMFWYKKDYNEHTKKYHCFYYDSVFVNPFVTGWSRSREKDFPDAGYIVSDSGGYQLGAHTKGVRASAMDVLRWQEQIADVGFTLDVPAYSYISEKAGYQYYTDEHFNRCMKVSNANAVKMHSHQENENMELWGVIQGGNYDNLKRWYDNLAKDCTFPGYSIPIASTSTPRHKESWLSQLKFAKELDTNFHFLGKCEPLMVITLAKLAQKTGKYYTYDTTSAATGLMLGKYTEPYFLSALNFTKHKDSVKFAPDSPLPCDCPVCQKFNVQQMIDGYYTLFLHNVYVRKRFNDYVNVMVQDDDIFNNLLNRILSQRSVYKKDRDVYKDKINNIIFDEPIKHSTVSDFTGKEEFDWSD